MRKGNIVIHIPAGRNWHYKDSVKNPRSGNRKVKIISFYHSGYCAIISPIRGNGKGREYVCNTSDLKEIDNEST